MHFALIAFCGYRVFSTIVYTLLNSYTRAAQRRDDIERQRSLMQDRHNPQYGSTAIIHSGGAATRVDQPCGQPQSLQAAPSNQTVQPYQTTQSSEGTRPYSEVQPQHATQLEQSRRLPDAAGQRTGPLDATAHSRAPSVPSRIRQLQFAQRLHCSLNDIGESSRQEAIIHQGQHGECVAHSPTYDLQPSNANKKSSDVASISDTEICDHVGVMPDMFRFPSLYTCSLSLQCRSANYALSTRAQRKYAPRQGANEP